MGFTLHSVSKDYRDFVVDYCGGNPFYDTNIDLPQRARRGCQPEWAGPPGSALPSKATPRSSQWKPDWNAENVTSRLVPGDRKVAQDRVSDIWKQASAVDLSAVTHKFVQNMPSIPPDKAEKVKRECLRWLILKSLAKDREVFLNFSCGGGPRDDAEDSRNEAAFRDNCRRVLSSQKRKRSADADGGSEEEEGSEEEGNEEIDINWNQSVDRYWHEFILFTELYMEFCTMVLGKFIHHRPCNICRPEEVGKEAYLAFYVEYSMLFEEEPPEEFFPDPDGKYYEGKEYIGKFQGAPCG